MNDVNNSIWKNINYLLEQDISIESTETYSKSNIKSIMNRYINRYERHIIQQLSEYYHGNAHFQKNVEITSLSSELILNVLSKKNNLYICIQGGSSFFPWIQFDFKERKILLESYTLQTYYDPGHFRSWILDVSDNGNDFTEIDRQNYNGSMNAPFSTTTIKVSCSTPQQFVRLIQIEQNWVNDYNFSLKNIEFTGFIYE